MIQSFFGEGAQSRGVVEYAFEDLSQGLDPDDTFGRRSDLSLDMRYEKRVGLHEVPGDIRKTGKIPRQLFQGTVWVARLRR